MTVAQVDKKTVNIVANLARLSLNEADAEKYSNDLSALLSWFSMLDEVNVDGVLPSSHVENSPTPFRVDEVTDGDQVEKVISNAVNSKFNMFAVPKVIE